MAASTFRIPAYRLHRPSGQAVVTLKGRDFYLGEHGSPESRAEYARLIAEWLAHGRMALPPNPGAESSDLTINELLLAYLQFADVYYMKNGRPTKEPELLRLSYRALRQLYGHTLARDFGPLALKAVQKAMINARLSRPEINRRVGRIIRAFKWAVAEEMVPASVHHGLRAVNGLKRGRTEAKELAPIKPVPDAFVDAIRPHVSRQVWAMVELQRLSAMRPGEVCQMRTCDLDTTGRIWVYTPERHKTEHHGRQRRIFLGPQAQAILRPWLRVEIASYLFSPREAVEERRAALREKRKTPVQPSQRNRAKRNPITIPSEIYTVGSYRRSIVYACKRANVPQWHPNRLRHNAATRLRREFGLDAARAVLGHSSPAVTEVYAELDSAKAAEVMERVG